MLAFDIISIVYGIAAAATLVQLLRNLDGFLGGEINERNWDLAVRIGFLFLTPIGVFVHELAHLLVAASLGAQNLAISFRVYWGFVSYSNRLGPEGEFLVGAAGPAASLLLGLGAVSLANRRGNLPSAALGAFAVSTLALVLVFYPIASFTWFGGDFLRIYSPNTPVLSLIAGLVHVIGLVGSIMLLRPWIRAAAPG